MWRLLSYGCLAFFFSTGFVGNVISESDLVDLVIYSYNRPLQLYALLESIEKYFTGVGVVSIVYRTDLRFSESYDEVVSHFSNYHFLKQGDKPFKDFKPLALQGAFESPNEYVAFAVDDIIVKDYTDLSDCVRWLKKTGAYGFYIRLGMNTTECYMMNDKPTPVPVHERLSDDVISWAFEDADGDWGYPNSNDMAIVKKQDIIDTFNKMKFASTSYEALWASVADLTLRGLCYNESKIVNIPMNLVLYEDPINGARNCGWYTTDELLGVFKAGLSIDVGDLYKINNKSPHMNYPVKFVNR